MSRRTVVTAAALSAAGLVAAVALTHTATARTTPAVRAEAPPAGTSAEHFAALQRDLGLTPAQARARLATDRKAGEVQALYQGHRRRRVRRHLRPARRRRRGERDRRRRRRR